MGNINQWKFDELPNSKIIITEKVLNRLQFLIGRTTWVPSEHSTILFGKKISEENIWLFDEVNFNEDYISEGVNSRNPLDYAVQYGEKQYEEMKNKVSSSPGTAVVDIHTHPSGLIEDFRFLSGGDLKACINLNSQISNMGGVAFSGLLGCDSINGNMSFSIIQYNKSERKFYRIQNIYLRKKLENGVYRDFPFVKYGNTQLIMQMWGDQNANMSEQSKEELNGFKHK